MQINNSLPGSFPDVTYHSDGYLYVSHINGDIYVSKWNGTTFDAFANFPCDGNDFARIHSFNGYLYLMYRPQNGIEIILRNLSTGEVFTVNGAFYNWSYVFGKDRYAINDLKVNCIVRELQTNQVIETLPWFYGTGLSYIDHNNTVISVDENRESMKDQGILNPEYAEEMICGEDFNAGIGIIYGGVKKVVATERFTFLPKIVKYTSNRWAIVTTDYHTIQFLYDISKEDILGTGPIEPPVTDIHLAYKSGMRIIID